MCGGGGEPETVFVPGVMELFEEQAAEQAGQHLDRCEECVAAASEAVGVDIEAAVWHQHVDMGVELEFLVPGVQHCGGTDSGTESFAVGTDGQQGPGAGCDQHAEHHPAVGVDQLCDHRRQGEHDVEVRQRQDSGLLFFQPAVGG